MWFSLVCLALLLAVAVKVGAQGLFGAFIMLVLTICCAAAAMGTHEWLAVHVLAQYWKPNYALPISLAVLFGIPLLILRLVFDRAIRRACLLPALVDRIGAGVFAVLTGLIMTGVMAVCVQMIPFDNGSCLGFSRVDVATRAERADRSAQPPPIDAPERGLLLSPDRFVTALTLVLSDGIFSGPISFLEHHPDMMQTIGWVGAADAEVARFAPPRSISVPRTAQVPYVYKRIPGNERQNEPTKYEPVTPKPGHEFRLVRVKFTREALDENKRHAFTLRQFRLVGTSADGETRQHVQYHPIALQQQPDPNDVTNRHILSISSGGKFWPIVDQAFSPHDGAEVEIVFELPKQFTPTFLEYKREARTRISFAAAAEPVAETPPPTSPAEAPPASPSRRSTAPAGEPPAPSSEPSDQSRSARDRRRGGRVRAATASSGGSHFGDDLPITLRSYQSFKNAEITRGAIASGHLVGDVDAQANGANPEVRRFDVPVDQRLLQLHAEGLESRSTFGRALSQAVLTVQNYFVTDNAGRRYKIVGKYAIATVNGRKVIEVQYFKDQVGSVGGVGPFRQIEETKLGAQDTFALLFLVEPGARIVSFSTGGAATRQDDLTAQNLTAPQ